jgi:hypothetical protein
MFLRNRGICIDDQIETNKTTLINNAHQTTLETTLSTVKERHKIDIFIKKRKCSHIVQIMDELSENILGIDFLQKFQLHYNHQNQQTQFLPNPSKALFATKSFTLPPFSTSLVQARSFQKIDNRQNYIADIGVPKHPLISGPYSWVSFDGNNHCTIQIRTAHLMKSLWTPET